MVIIIILKLNLRIDSRQSSGHWSRSGSRIEFDPSQCKNESNYYHSFKARFEG